MTNMPLAERRRHNQPSTLLAYRQFADNRQILRRNEAFFQQLPFSSKKGGPCPRQRPRIAPQPSGACPGYRQPRFCPGRANRLTERFNSSRMTVVDAARCMHTHARPRLSFSPKASGTTVSSFGTCGFWQRATSRVLTFCEGIKMMQGQGGCDRGDRQPSSR